MSKTSIAELDRIQTSLRRDILMRSMRDDAVSITVGMGDGSTFEQARSVVKAVCAALDTLALDNVVMKEKEYDNEDGAAPIVWIQVSADSDTKIFKNVTPESAMDIVLEELKKGGAVS